MQYQTILVRDADSVRVLMLNRPERRNAMTPRMQYELLHAFDDAAEAASCRALVIEGAGEVFCSGLDLEQLWSLEGRPTADHAADARRLGVLFRRLYELPLPTIAAVHGAAVAGGAGLAMICDYTLASPEAKMGFPEVRIGFVPALVSAYLGLQIGDKRARGLLLSGRLIAAEQALGLGLVNEIVPRDRLAARGMELAGELAASSPQAIGATKTLLAEQNRAWLDQATEAAMGANAKARATTDFREGVAAFLEKRKPVWQR